MIQTERQTYILKGDILGPVFKFVNMEKMEINTISKHTMN
jgi:hypothetical protein